MALEVLTLLSKATRVSRTCDPETLVGEAGLWVELNAAGGVLNVGATKPKIAKMLFNGNSANAYESHDVSLGRITTLETIGARCKVTGAFYKGVVNAGDDLYVNFNDTEDNGKLCSAQVTGAGSYNVVAKAEEVGSSYIVFSMVSPISLTIAP